jgi:hypothetical protein
MWTLCPMFLQARLARARVWDAHKKQNSNHLIFMPELLLG